MIAPVPGHAGLPQVNDALFESVWRAPLVPAALVFTAGIVLDHLFAVGLIFGLLLCGGGLLAFVLARLGGHERLGLAYLALAGLALGMAYHHYRHHLFANDDIGRLARDQPWPVLLVGTLDEEPRRLPAPLPDPLRSQQATATVSTLVVVERLFESGAERTVSGRVRVVVRAARGDDLRQPLAGLHPGDQVEVRGQLVRLAPKANPGEFDRSDYWEQRGVHALVTVRQADQVRRLRLGWVWSPAGWLGALRNTGHELLEDSLPRPVTRSLARALLLGEGAPMTSDAWAKYVRTGVVHVLAISGQHLVIVAMFLWFASRPLGFRQRHTALVVAFVLLGYALVTGGRPPALRAGVSAFVACLGLVAGKPILPANLLALGWLVVVGFDPGSVFEQGCQLSFVAVAVLFWGGRWLLPDDETDPLDRVIDESRPAWLRTLRWIGWYIGKSYALCLVVWLAISPLAAFHSGVLAPANLLLGPPLTLLTALALLFGFVLMILAALSATLAAPLGWIVHLCLLACEELVDVADSFQTHVHVGKLSSWPVAVFYVLLMAGLTHTFLRQRWRWAIPGGLAWLCLALVLGAAPRTPSELRCTFLAVGHGGAVVLEFPDGRTLLYDVGSMRGPNVTATTIAPFLWSRKIQRLDDVILSHADLDHYNGLIALAERFAIGRVLTSEAFADRDNLPVRHTLDQLGKRRIPYETLHAGVRLTAGSVRLEVLHPAAGWRASTQNAQSLVVEVRYADHVVLLTGDLEGEGLSRLIGLPPRRVNVLQAPHHGSTRVDAASLVGWCRPELVVSCQGAPRSGNKQGGPYSRNGARFWSTHREGAITLRSGPTGLLAETYLHGQRLRLRP